MGKAGVSLDFFIPEPESPRFLSGVLQPPGLVVSISCPWPGSLLHGAANDGARYLRLRRSFVPHHSLRTNFDGNYSPVRLVLNPE